MSVLLDFCIIWIAGGMCSFWATAIVYWNRGVNFGSHRHQLVGSFWANMILGPISLVGWSFYAMNSARWREEIDIRNEIWKEQNS